MIFLGLKFWPKAIFLGPRKTPGFFGVSKKTVGYFWVVKKGLRNVFGHAKKSSDFYR